MTVENVIENVRSYRCRLVEITGGEPLHQPGAFPLIEALCVEDFEVLIETSGAIDTSLVDTRAQIILDVKCPGSGMMDRMNWENLVNVREKDQVKFVIKDRGDYDWAVEIVNRYELIKRCPVLFSPVFEELGLRELAEWILRDGLSVRFQLQLHKYIWGPQVRGV